MEPSVAPAYLTTEQAAEYLSLSPYLLAVWRKRGGGPRYLKTAPGRNGAVRYHRPDLDAWAEARKVASTSEGPR
jgi:hypothetical protein